VLDRAWVGYETWVACFYCAHQHRNAAEPSLLLALPDGLDLTPVTSLLAQCSQGLDLSRMETSRAEDKLRIVAEVKRAMGVKRMQVFDTDQTGELELSQFVSALEVSGFAAEEAAAVFDTVDTDGSGTVSKEEFEKWWIQLFELGGASAYLGVDTSYHSLVTNMESYLHLLASFWHREDLAASLRQLLERQQRKWEAGKVKLALAVPPYSLRGSYMEVMDVVVFKISHADYLAGGRLVFRLLQQNLDALALNEAPEHCMVPPEQLSSSMLQQLSLAWWLALLAE
ncbi:EF-hand domain-containing protein, partial [Haematococcus lacustris]